MRARARGRRRRGARVAVAVSCDADASRCAPTTTARHARVDADDREHRARTRFRSASGWHPFFPKRRGTTLALRCARRVAQRRDAACRSSASPVPAAWSFDAARCPATSTLDNVFERLDGRCDDRRRRSAASRSTIDADRALRPPRRVRARRAATSSPRARDAHDRRVQSRRARRAGHRHARAAPRRARFLVRCGSTSAAPHEPAEPMTASRVHAACSTSRRASANARSGRSPSRCSTGSTSTRRRSTASIPRPARNRAMPMPSSIGCFALRERGGFVVALRDGIWLADARRQARAQGRRRAVRSCASSLQRRPLRPRRAASSSAR